MNILLVSHEYPPYGSGIANAVYALRRELLKKGVNVDVLSQGGAEINITNAFTNLPGLAGLIPFWQQAVDYISRVFKDYDIIWLHAPLLVNTRKLRHTKKVMISFHTTYYGFYTAYKKHSILRLLPYYYLANKLENHFLNQLSHNKNVIITAISSSIADELSSNGLIFSPHIIPNGFESDYHGAFDKYNARAILQQKYSLQLSEKDQLFLYIGRITEQKQIFLLVNLFKKINSNSNSNIHLIIIGSGNLFKKLNQKSYSEYNIHILGYVPSGILSIAQEAADAYILLSCYEGLPLTVLEAASFNLPLILSDIPAHRWMIKSRMVNGLLIDSVNPSPTKIINFLNAGIKEKKVKRAHNWEKVADQYMQIFLNTITK